MHANMRTDRRKLIHFMARRWFGVTDRVTPAPQLEQHEDYGGPLTTVQFRNLSKTHYSFVQYPLTVSVPARFVTEVIINRKLDRAKRQGLHLRVAEQHGNVLPPPPPGLTMDSSAPAAPRGSAARAAAARSRLLAGEAPVTGQKKQRVATNDSGERVTVDRAYVENIVQRTAERHRAKPKARHALETMMNIQEMTFDDMMSSSSTTISEKTHTVSSATTPAVLSSNIKTKGKKQSAFARRRQVTRSNQKNQNEKDGQHLKDDDGAPPAKRVRFNV